MYMDMDMDMDMYTHTHTHTHTHTQLTANPVQGGRAAHSLRLEQEVHSNVKVGRSHSIAGAREVKTSNVERGDVCVT